MLKKLIYGILFFLVVSIESSGQTGFQLASGEKYETIRFRFVNNLIIIPVEVNGVELSFILDTGVSKPILFNLSDSDSLQIRNVEEITLKGLGGDSPVKAFRSLGNRFKMKNIYNNNQELYVLLDSDINFSPRLGFPVHGIIGNDLFKDFVVEINYVRHKIKFHDPLTYFYRNCGGCRQLDIYLVRDKPFVDAELILEGETVKVELLIDSGSSDAVWLFQDEEKRLRVPERHFDDFLGRGLSGSIYGKRARVDVFRLKDFELNNAKVAFPDSISIKHLSNLGTRDGSIGTEILKRFHVIMDYQQGLITLRKNRNFKTPFKYNMSGIELQHNGLRVVKEVESNLRNFISSENNNANAGIKIMLSDLFKYELHPAFEIAEIRHGSPAEIAGLKIGDVIVSVNGKPTYRYSLQEVSQMLNVEDGKIIRLLVDRGGVELKFSFELKQIL